MSENRHDWLNDRWVIFAPLRSDRPDEFAARVQEPSTSHRCPFCIGREHETPPAILTLNTSGVKGRSRRWQVRVVPNRYPALQAGEARSSSNDEAYEQVALPSSFDSYTSTSLKTSVAIDVMKRRPVYGAHEVIIESPQHVERLTDLTEEESLLVFEAYRERLICLRADDRLAHAVVFKNVGAEAGASLSHSHSQLIATDFVPSDVARTCQRLVESYEQHEQHFFEQVIDHELHNGERIVFESRHFVAYTPFASIVPYFVCVVPKTRESRFEDLDDERLVEFNGFARILLQALEKILPKTAYNYILQTCPFDGGWDQVFHWRWELFPRLTKAAGFEWGTMCFINPVLPEHAASQLRRAIEEIQG
jgi:UDPglucose--hexose-1-phosphate uridylyltransferase